MRHASWLGVLETAGETGEQHGLGVCGRKSDVDPTGGLGDARADSFIKRIREVVNSAQTVLSCSLYGVTPSSQRFAVSTLSLPPPGMASGGVDDDGVVHAVKDRIAG